MSPHQGTQYVFIICYVQCSMSIRFPLVDIGVIHVLVLLPSPWALLIVMTYFSKEIHLII